MDHPAYDVNLLVHASAYLSLVTFTAKSSLLRDVLIRMALEHGTISGSALFYALHAFASLHRNGLQQQAVQLKIAALQCLSASTKEALGSPAEAAQQVAASMLLGAFEVSREKYTLSLSSDAHTIYEDHETGARLRRVAIIYLGGRRHYPGNSTARPIARK